MTQITDHLADIEARVAAALRRSKRPEQRVTLVAASKQRAPTEMRAGYAAGLRHFGESYLQEALPKVDALADLAITWHFLGRIQANKTKTIAERFDVVHTIDRAKIAERLDGQRPAHAPRLDVLLQVNLGAEPQKAGVTPVHVPTLAERVASLPRLRLRGLMCIPPLTQTNDEARPFFSQLRRLLDALRAAGHEADCLSMGMSQDFEAAIEEGSTCIRIGTALFGPRSAR